jgi:hypothetical protein
MLSVVMVIFTLIALLLPVVGLGIAWFVVHYTTLESDLGSELQEQMMEYCHINTSCLRLIKFDLVLIHRLIFVRFPHFERLRLNEKRQNRQ